MRWSEPPPGDPHRDVTGALHDVSNALTVLLGWVAETRSGRPSPEQLDRALSIIEDRARTARDLARRAIGSDTPVVDREDTVDNVVGQVVEALAVETQRAGVSLAVHAGAPGTRIPVAGDASQILTNLLLNALAWAPRGSQVTIETRVEGALRSTSSCRTRVPASPTGQAGRVFGGSHQHAKAGSGSA